MGSATFNGVISNVLAGETVTKIEIAWLLEGTDATAAAAVLAGRTATWNAGTEDAEIAAFISAGQLVTSELLIDTDTYNPAVRITKTLANTSVFTGPWSTGTPAAGNGDMLSATFASGLAPFNNTWDNLSAYYPNVAAAGGKLTISTGLGCCYAAVVFDRTGTIEFDIDAMADDPSGSSFLINTASSLTAFNVDNYRFNFGGGAGAHTIDFAKTVSSSLTAIGSAMNVGTGAGAYKITFDTNNVYFYKDTVLLGTFATGEHTAFTRIGINGNAGDIWDNVRVY